MNSRLGAAESGLSRNFRAWMVGVLLVATLVRIVACMLRGDIDPATANIWEYGDIAKLWYEHGSMVRTVDLPDGGTYVFPTAFMPPLQVFIWRGLFALLGPSPAALVVALCLNVLFGVGVVYATMLIARRLVASAIVALAAGAWIALHPVFVFTVATYHAVNLYLVLFLALFVVVTRSGQPGAARILLAGALFGAGMLARTEYVMLCGAVIVGAYFIHRNLRATLSMLLVGVLVVLPWTVRSYVLFDKVIPIANSTGFGLYKGFNPEANGSGNWVDDNGVADRRLGEQLRAVPLTPRYEIERDNVYREAAKQFMREEPVRAFVELPVRKLALFWFFDIYDALTHQWLYQLALWTLIVPSTVGLFLVGRRLVTDPVHLTVMLTFLAQSVVMCGYAVHARYRLNVEPFLMVYGAYAIFHLLGGRQAGSGDAVAGKG